MTFWSHRKLNMDRFRKAEEFRKNPPSRMASNTPSNALIVFDGWMGQISGAIWFKALRELKIDEVYSVCTINETDGEFTVVLNEISGAWPISLFTAYKI